MKLNIQLFGGRGASSSIREPIKERSGLKSYFKSKRINERLKDVAFKSGNKDLISDGYSIYQVEKTGLQYSKDEKLTNQLKGFEKQLNDFSKQAKEYNSIDNYITDKENYNVDKDYSFDTKRIKQAKSVLGRDTQASIVYEEWGSIKNPIRQPRLVFKNKKGEKGFLLPQRKF